MESERQERLRERLLSDDEVRAAISLRAYEIYQRRGGEPGREIEDWVQAENEILEALIKGEPQLVAESSAARVLPADTPSTAGDQKNGKAPAALMTRNFCLALGRPQNRRKSRLQRSERNRGSQLNQLRHGSPK